MSALDLRYNAWLYAALDCHALGVLAVALYVREANLLHAARLKLCHEIHVQSSARKEYPSVHFADQTRPQCVAATLATLWHPNAHSSAYDDSPAHH